MNQVSKTPARVVRIKTESSACMSRNDRTSVWTSALFSVNMRGVHYGYRSISIEVSALLSGHSRRPLGTQILDRDCGDPSEKARGQRRRRLERLRVLQTGSDERTASAAWFSRGGRRRSATPGTLKSIFKDRRAARRGHADQETRQVVALQKRGRREAVNGEARCEEVQQRVGHPGRRDRQNGGRSGRG